MKSLRVLPEVEQEIDEALRYRVYPNELLVVAVMHQARRPGYWLGRKE